MHQHLYIERLHDETQKLHRFPSPQQVKPPLSVEELGMSQEHLERVTQVFKGDEMMKIWVIQNLKMCQFTNPSEKTKKNSLFISPLSNCSQDGLQTITN